MVHVGANNYALPFFGDPMNDSDLAAKLAEFLALPEGWDSYGARRVSPHAVDTARRLINDLFVCPMSNGGIQIELGETEIVIDPEGNVTP